MKKIMYLLVIGIMVVLVGCGSTTTAPVKETVPTPVAATTPTPTPAPEKKWVQVGTWTATGKKNTENFTIEDGSEYRISWETFTPDKTLSLFIDNEKGESQEMLIDVKGVTKDSSPIRVPAGKLSLIHI